MVYYVLKNVLIGYFKSLKEVNWGILSLWQLILSHFMSQYNISFFLGHEERKKMLRIYLVLSGDAGG